MSKASKKSEPASFVRLVRVRVPNSHHAAYQIEKIVASGDKVLTRGLIGNPDTLEMILAKTSEALDPESAMHLEPIDAVIG